MRTVERLGYVLRVRVTSSDGRYHDTTNTAVEVLDRDGSVLHEVFRSDRSSHQLGHRYRPSASREAEAIEAAECWLVNARPDAAEADRHEVERGRAQARSDRRAAWEAAGRDDVAYALSRPDLFSATDVARILGFRNVREANRLMTEWGLQTKDSTGYLPVSAVLAAVVGDYAQLRWRAAGLKAIWDAGVAAGRFTGGDAEFGARVRANTRWFDFLAAGE